MSRARTFLGQMGWQRRRNLLGQARNSNFVLKISIRYDLPEEEVIDTLLHEMIHCYIAANNLKDSSAHGKRFRQEMERINRTYNRHLTISHRRTEEEKQQDKQRRQHLVCVSKMAQGWHGITIAQRSSLFTLWDGLPRVPDILETHWYSTTDCYFNRYPRSRTLRVYRVPKDELDEHLKDAIPLIREGRKILVKKE